MLYLEAITENMCSLTLEKPDIRTHYRDDQHHHLSDVKLLLTTCTKKILSR